MRQPFLPSGDTVTVSATSVTSAAAVGAGSLSATRVVRVAAPASNGAIAFVEFGASTVTATTAKMPVLPGTVEIFYVGGKTHIAAITASGAATLYVTPGEGA